MAPAAPAIPFRLDAGERERALRLFNARGEIQWFQFEAHDQLGHRHQVAQFQQVARDMEGAVELLDLVL
jgi:hypothetical protein